MADSINTKLYEFITEPVTPLRDFESWVYKTPQLEAILGEANYLKLISINYSDKAARQQVVQIVDEAVNYASIHRQEILATIRLLINKECSVMADIQKLHRYTSIGYLFIGEVDLIAEFNDQGRSILLQLANVTHCSKT